MKKKIGELTDKETELICAKYQANKTCLGCPLKIGTDGCLKYVDLDQEIEVEDEIHKN